MIQNNKAFTLMELLVVILIIAILFIIAIPTYQGYVLRENRSDVIQTLFAIQLSQQKYRQSHSTYGNLSQMWGGVTTTKGGHYTLSITGISSTSFTIQADAVGSQVKDQKGGVTCSPMVLSYTSGIVTKSPSVCWSSP